MWDKRNDYKKLLGKWRVLCDRSGFFVLSDRIVRDHRNRLVDRDYVDPIHPVEFPMKSVAEDTRLPFRRPIVPDPSPVAVSATWSNAHIKWKDLHGLWRDEV